MGTVHELPSDRQWTLVLRLSGDVSGRDADCAEVAPVFRLLGLPVTSVDGCRRDGRQVWALVYSGGAGRRHSVRRRVVGCCAFHFGQHLIEHLGFEAEPALAVYTALEDSESVFMLAEPSSGRWVLACQCSLPLFGP